MTVDNVNDGPAVVYGAPGLPRIWQLYQTPNESDVYARCRKVTPKRAAPNSFLWLVECEYSTPDPKNVLAETQASQDNPLLDLPQISLSYETFQTPVWATVSNVSGNDLACSNATSNAPTVSSGSYSFGGGGSGAIIITGGTGWLPGTYNITSVSGGDATIKGPCGSNASCSGGVFSAVIYGGQPRSSAGEVYNPTIMRDHCRAILTISRNEDIASPVASLSAAYMDAINFDVFFGCAPHTVKVKSIGATREVKNTSTFTPVVFLKVSYVFEIASWPGWDVVLMDQGTFYKDGSGNTIHFVTTTGQPFTGLLDGGGGNGGQPSGHSATTPAYLPPMQVYPELPFSLLNLPNSFLPLY